MSTAPTHIKTLGDLKSSGYQVRSVKEEMRENLIRSLREGRNVFEGILGYDDSVVPQIHNAILGRHDMILLGLRGQAKSRVIRMLPNLLDDFIPIVEGSDVNDDPFAPISKYGRDLLASRGDQTPLAWLPRSERYGEKLATPDTTMADLIGDIDPIKAAHRRLTYADEEVIHFGIIPRTNRGIFAINELPDLQPRIQVGLLNVLEEQDIQIRGFHVRFPLDLMMVFTANPEDYTNRGNIITPLKDRIDSQIITHYPRDVDTGIQITRQEAWEERGESAPAVTVPHFFRQIIEEIAREARTSEYVDHKSGVSVRLTRAALENLISAAERRAILNGERETVVRVSDLHYVEPAVTGKVELVYEGEQEGAQNVARMLIGLAIRKVFIQHFPDPSDKQTGRSSYKDVLDWFAGGKRATIEPNASFQSYVGSLDQIAGLRETVRHTASSGTPAETAVAMEFVLEALHQHSLIGKEIEDDGLRYSDMMGSMLSSLGSIEDADEEELPFG
jgi:magnesium chelatase subunit I